MEISGGDWTDFERIKAIANLSAAGRTLDDTKHDPEKTSPNTHPTKIEPAPTDEQVRIIALAGLLDSVFKKT